MSYAERLVHTLVIERPYGSDGIDVGSDIDLDDYGQPVRVYSAAPDATEVQGLIQPKSAREIALISQAGAALSDHTIFTQRIDLLTSDRIRDITDASNGPTYEIVGIRDFNFGGTPHYEVDAKKITSASTEEAAS